MQLLLVGTGRACLPDFTCGLVSLSIFGVSFGVLRLVAVYLEKTTRSVSHLLCCICLLTPSKESGRGNQPRDFQKRSQECGKYFSKQNNPVFYRVPTQIRKISASWSRKVSLPKVGRLKSGGFEGPFHPKPLCDPGPEIFHLFVCWQGIFQAGISSSWQLEIIQGI